MRFTSIALRNWKNFGKVPELNLGSRAFLIGPNASGKSNFLDAFRFLRDTASIGLARSAAMRGGISSIRCLSARRLSDIEISVTADVDSNKWRYELVLVQDNNSRPRVKRERVSKDNAVVTDRPDAEDKADQERLGYTAIEQVVANQKFRPLAEFFKDLRYQNLLPQVVRDPKGFSPIPVADDPFGRDFLMRLWQTPVKVRDARLKKICAVLRVAVPQFTSMKVELDSFGSPHLIVGYEHWRSNLANQQERDLSDGTLRLLGLLWGVYEGKGPLLLEEPEICLHREVVRHLPQMLERVNQQRKIKRQLIVSTHSEDLLFDKGIAPEEVLWLKPTPNGTEINLATAEDKALVKAGLSAAEIFLPKTAPAQVSQLDLALVE